MHENREISYTSWTKEQDRSAKAINQTADMNVHEKSDCPVVPVNQPNILSAYGYVESDPDTGGPPKPELTLWASAGYNPVSAASSFQNVNAGDRTANATST